jgi:hypothetical protein
LKRAELIEERAPHDEDLFFFFHRALLSAQLCRVQLWLFGKRAGVAALRASFARRRSLMTKD